MAVGTLATMATLVRNEILFTIHNNRVARHRLYLSYLLNRVAKHHNIASFYVRTEPMKHPYAVAPVNMVVHIHWYRIDGKYIGANGEHHYSCHQ